MHATLYHLGAPAQRDLLSGDRDRLARIEGLSPAARQAITVALAMIEALDAQIEPLRGELVGFARRQPGCPALQAEYGIGASTSMLTAVVIWSEMGGDGRGAPVRPLPRRGTPRRAGHHRLLLRQQTLTGAAVPPRLPAAALGAV